MKKLIAAFLTLALLLPQPAFTQQKFDLSIDNDARHASWDMSRRLRMVSSSQVFSAGENRPDARTREMDTPSSIATVPTAS